MTTKLKEMQAMRDDVALMAFKHMDAGLTMAEAVAALRGAIAIMLSTLPDNQRPVVCKIVTDGFAESVEQRAAECRASLKGSPK